MQKFYVLVAGAVILSVISGASLATVFQQNSAEQPLLGQRSLQQSPAVPENSASPVTATNHDTENPIKTSPQPQPQTSVVANVPQLDDFPHQRINLPDEVKAGTEFDQFRQRLRQAVHERNAQFVQSILPEDQLGIGFGSQKIADLNLENPNDYFWSLLEKALAIGCFKNTDANYNNVDAAAGIWTCNNVRREFSRQYPPPKHAQGVEHESNHVVVVGNKVNVRSQPEKNSRIVGVLSNEVVKVNQDIEKQQAEKRQQQGQDYDPINGWTPVILANGRQGYVSNRFAYSPLENGAEFGKVNERWQLLYMPGGD